MSGWIVIVSAVLSCALGAGAHAVVSDGGVEIARSQEATAYYGDAVKGSAEPPADEAPPPIVVHVDGAVLGPGVYDLPEDARVGDAVDAAGGLSEGADLSGVNLAAHVSDGDKVHIPVEGEEPQAQGQPIAGASSSQDGVVNINTASVEELCTLPGVGEATANAIVEDRERLGPFASPEDIMRVSGIGEKKYERMRDKIRVS